MSLVARWLVVLSLGALASPLAAQLPQDPVLRSRPLGSAVQSVPHQPPMRLDLVVRDAQGRPVAGLQPWDFKLFDNGQPRKVVFFRAFNATIKPEPSVETILVIDEVNLPFTEVAFVKEQLAQFFSRNNGRLTQPTMLMLLTDAGLQVQAAPTTRGEVLLKLLKGIHPELRTVGPAMGGSGALDRFQRSVHQMTAIAENEARKPGRKLLIWIGPGWPMLESERFAPPGARDQGRYFHTIVELTNKLREAEIVLDSVSGSDPTDSSSGNVLYEAFLKGVDSPRQASGANLNLRVLATQAGGLVLGPNNDLVGQIDRCLADAPSFYQIWFTPLPAQHPDEYHALKLEVNRPDLSVRTTAAYYAEPAGN